jgi:hypothetical protein
LLKTAIFSERSTVVIRWDEKAGLRRDTIGSQVIDALEAQEITETSNKMKKISTAAEQIIWTAAAIYS